MPALKQRGSAKESFASSAEACFTIEIGFESSAGSMYTAPVCACVRVRETEKSLSPSLPGFETSHVVNTILLRLIYAYRLDFLIYNTIPRIIAYLDYGGTKLLSHKRREMGNSFCQE